LSTHTPVPFPQAPLALQRGTQAPSTQTESFEPQSLVIAHAFAGASQTANASRHL
jgi:hypothetical protein